LDNPNANEDDCKAGDESDIQSGNGMKASEQPEHHVMSIALIAPGLIQPIRRSLNQADTELVTVSATERRRSK
jgi:hypothetical protein